MERLPTKFYAKICLYHRLTQCVSKQNIDFTNSFIFSLTKIFTVNYIHKRKSTIIEGELRCKELAEYLEKLKAPKAVVISEDASGIVSKVSFDSATGQLIGLELPTDFKTGCPTPFTFIPHTMNEIENQIKNNRMSSLVYLVLAQPILDNAPPFVLQVFGTSNTFKSQNVYQRWKHTKDQLER